MTQTMEAQTHYDTIRTDLTSDEQTLPPFVALDELDKAVAQIDDWVSHFIGRMVPYSHGLGTVSQAAKPLELNADKSGLENRIYATTLRVHAIREALDEMSEGLRL